MLGTPIPTHSVENLKIQCHFHLPLSWMLEIVQTDILIISPHLLIVLSYVQNDGYILGLLE